MAARVLAAIVLIVTTYAVLLVPGVTHFRDPDREPVVEVPAAR